MRFTYSRKIMSRMTIVRYGSPSGLDEAVYGSQCIVKHHDSEAYEIYLQVGKDREKPKWEHIGQFTPHSSQDYINKSIEHRLGE